MRSGPKFRFLISLLVLAGCAGGERRAKAPEPSKRLTVNSAATRQCLADLAALGASYQVLPDRDFGHGCYAFSSVKLTNIGVPVTNLGAMSCPLAKTFTAWIRNGAMPAARVYLGHEVAKVESFGTYSCRNVNGASTGRLSEHAFANAVDVAAFVLDDGRRIAIKTDWRSPDPQVRAFLEAVHTSACRRFKTVLSPDYNSLHHDHLHLDMGRGPFCR